MDLNAKLTILERMVAIYDRFLADYDLACEKFCTHCCTANVTMTTLEGFRIFNHPVTKPEYFESDAAFNVRTIFK